MAVMADEVPYPFSTSNEMVEHLIESMLYKFRNSKKNPELAAKIEAAYKKTFGAEMLPEGSSVIEPICQHGLPGVGKSTAGKIAAKEVEKMLGMNLVINPVPPYMPKPNDFVLATLEMSGEVSNILMGGIPLASELKDPTTGMPVSYMGKLPMYQLAILPMADAGMLVLDDFVNAAPVVQGTCMSIALEGRFQMIDLKDTYITLTANLGALDNSDISPLSDPMVGRMMHYYVEDNLDDFAKRVAKTHTDKLADVGVLSFLKKNEDLFMMRTDSEHRDPVNGVRGSYPSPRTWMKTINSLRILLNRQSGLSRSLDENGEQAPIESLSDFKKINNVVQSGVGKYTATRFSSYLYYMMTGASPFSEKLIKTGDFDSKIFDREYGTGSSRGVSSEQQDFAYQLAFCLANEAAGAIKEDPTSGNLKTVVERYTKGIMELDDPVINLSLSHFGNRLIGLLPEWSVKNSLGEPSYLNMEKAREVFAVIFKGSSSRGIDKALAKSMTHALMGAENKEGYTSVLDNSSPTP